MRSAPCCNMQGMGTKQAYGLAGRAGQSADTAFQPPEQPVSHGPGCAHGPIGPWPNAARQQHRGHARQHPGAEHLAGRDLYCCGVPQDAAPAGTSTFLSQGMREACTCAVHPAKHIHRVTIGCLTASLHLMLLHAEGLACSVTSRCFSMCWSEVAASLPFLMSQQVTLRSTTALAYMPNHPLLQTLQQLGPAECYVVRKIATIPKLVSMPDPII